MAKKTPSQPAVVEDLNFPEPENKKEELASEVEFEKEEPALTPSAVDRIVESPKEEEPKSTEEKIVGFLKARNTGGFIPINDFLKSIYGIPKGNDPKAWHDQRTMKLLKIMLDKMVSDGFIVIEGGSHQRLSRHYYPDSATGATHYYNLDTLPLRAKLA